MTARGAIEHGEIPSGQYLVVVRDRLLISHDDNGVNLIIGSRPGETAVNRTGLRLILHNGEQCGDGLAIGGYSARGVGQSQINGLVVFHRRTAEETNSEGLVGLTI